MALNDRNGHYRVALEVGREELEWMLSRLEREAHPDRAQKLGYERALREKLAAEQAEVDTGPHTYAYH